MSAYPHHSLRELDEATGVAKGSAFRAFKQLRPALHEGRDYRVLHHEADHAELAQLRSADRIYRSSVNVVLLSADAAQRVSAALQASAAAVGKGAR